LFGFDFLAKLEFLVNFESLCNNAVVGYFIDGILYTQYENAIQPLSEKTLIKTA
jgi:hypothetical protein